MADEDDEDELAELVLVDVLNYHDDVQDEDDSTDFASSDEATEEETAARQTTQVTYDTSLPTEHAYLGNDLEELHGHTIHDIGSVITLPLLSMPGIVLFPGQTVPLNLFQQRIISMMRACRSHDRTFAFLPSLAPFVDFAGNWSHDYMQGSPKIGTTTEIYSICDQSDVHTGISSMRMKAIGRQRFVMLESWRQPDGISVAKVRILPEVDAGDPLQNVRQTSHDKFNVVPNKASAKATMKMQADGSFRSVMKHSFLKYNRFAPARLTRWPQWVYKAHDSTILMDAIKAELKKWNPMLNLDNVPSSATAFSFWIGSNIPLRDNMKFKILCMDSAVQRLRYALSLIKQSGMVKCHGCGVGFASKMEVFTLSAGGPSATYVNPNGYVHDIITVHHAKNLRLRGSASNEHSWFPGYAWTIAECRRCQRHIGWKFTAEKNDLEPETFFGLSHASAAIQPSLEFVLEDKYGHAFSMSRTGTLQPDNT